MRKITRMVLISAALATSGLTAKIATENYNVMATNDERIHKAYELAKNPNKAAVLEAIVDATNTEPDERIQKAVVIEAEGAKTPKVVRVTTSAGVSPKVDTMDKKTINKAEEFIEEIAHPAEVVMNNKLDFTPGTIPVQELTYEIKDIFPEFEEITEKPLTYKITLPADGYVRIVSEKFYVFNGNDKLNCIDIVDDGGYAIGIPVFIVNSPGDKYVDWTKFALWVHDNDTNVIKYDPETRTLDYSALVPLKDSNEQIPADKTLGEITYKQVYTFLTGVEKGDYPFLPDTH